MKTTLRILAALLLAPLLALAQPHGGPGGAGSGVGAPFPGGAVNSVPFISPANVWATDPSNFTYTKGTGTLVAPKITATTTFSGPISSSAASITGGTITGTNVPYVLAKWAIPFIVYPTGTMANNGAATSGTALSDAYTGGAWALLPAGAIAAGVPAAAAWLWYVGTDTTHGTFYNSTYTTGVPGLGTTTAFATTGPGAFTGVTAATNGPVITVPANSLAASGHLKGDTGFSLSNNANGKTLGALVNSVDYAGFSMTSGAASRVTTDIYNRGLTNKNAGHSLLILSGATSPGAFHYDTADYTTGQTFTYKFTRGTATDVMTMEFGEVWVEN